jgi:endoglucanase
MDVIEGRPNRRRRHGQGRASRWHATAVPLALLFLAVPVVRALVGNQAAARLRGSRLWVSPDTPARKQADEWQRSRPEDAAQMRRIADQPQAIWLGEWVRDIRGEADAIASRSEEAHAMPVLVAYNIPYRDCGLHSRGGAGGGDDYRRWIIELARGLDNRPSVVILEPDGLPAIDCLPARLRDERYVLLRDAVRVLTKAGAAVYVDAGNGNWQQPQEMANRLLAAGIAGADGFSLNVANFHSTSVNVAYGNRLSQLIGGKHYVIDTSRNGRGESVEREWCNAPNQALGHVPTTNTGLPLVDAYLWVKTPGQSDGACNGGPRAGDWWPEYALGLSRKAEQLGSLNR